MAQERARVRRVAAAQEEAVNDPARRVKIRPTSKEARMTARRFLTASFVASVLAVAVPAFAQKPADAPENATAQCTDNTYSTAKTKQGACSKHGGVKTWWGPSTDSAPASTTKSSTSAPTSSNAAPAGSTAQCKDGSFSSAKTKQGACSGHGGIATWYADTPKSTATPAPSSTPSATKNQSTTVSKIPTDAPANATAKCNDGTYSFAKQHSGACSHHKGVAEWYK